MLALAIDQARAWAKDGHRLQLSVNVSANLVDRRLATELADLLQAARLPPRLLRLEITESAVMDDPVSATRALDQLAALGLGGVSIDDFGTGHSSLGRLRDLPIDSLKVDRTFVAELDRGVDPAFVRSVIELGHYLGLHVVAEGVEDEQTWKTLAHLGCDSGQGYWLSPPLPAAEIPAWLAAHDPERLAELGSTGDRRHGAGRRALDRIAGSFDRAPGAILVSDRGNCWVAINAAARELLSVRTSSIVQRHVDETLRDVERGELSQVLAELGERGHASGTCEVTIGDSRPRKIRYELREATIPHHHIWFLSCESAVN